MQSMITSAQTMIDALAGVAYATDSEGRIELIGRRGWSLFAADSGAPEVADRDLFIGRHLFDFVAGDDVRAAYARLFQRIRQGEPQIVVPCHCDGPAVVRDMRLSITPLRHGRALRGFLFQSLPVSERTRPPMPLYEFCHVGLPHPETAPLLGMCSLCERVCLADDGESWVEAEVYYAKGGTSHVRISHTVCPSCFRHWVEGWSSQPPAY